MEYLEQHRIWELRHAACRACHSDPEAPWNDHEGSAQPCICGPEPCKRCGYQYGDVDLLDNAEGCGRCSAPESEIKTIHEEASWMVLLVNCPYCQATNVVDGNNTMGGYGCDVLQCWLCSKRAWLGEDTEYDHESIDHEDVRVDVGKPYLEEEAIWLLQQASQK